MHAAASKRTEQEDIHQPQFLFQFEKPRSGRSFSPQYLSPEREVLASPRRAFKHHAPWMPPSPRVEVSKHAENCKMPPSVRSPWVSLLIAKAGYTQLAVSLALRQAAQMGGEL